MSGVRPKAVCVFRRGPEILVSSAEDRVKGDRYFGPPGGGIEFGEYSAVTARRELREELGVELEEPVLLGVLENVFECDGAPGHEILFVYAARFEDSSFYEAERSPCVEERAMAGLSWERLDSFGPNGRRLVPDGLYDLLCAG